MEAYRKTIKDHFESMSVWKKILDVDFIFWGLGLALYILGGCLIWASSVAAGVLNGLGSWMILFGLVIAFIKKDDWGLMITTAGIALFSLVMFIIIIARAGVVDFSSMYNLLGYGTLFIVACRSSDAVKKAEIRRAQQAAILTQQMQSAGGVACPSCGAVLTGGSLFCNVCGTKRPEQKRCPSCGYELMDGAQFCNQCGASMAAQKTCAFCGKSVSESDVFCPGCGTKAQ